MKALLLAVALTSCGKDNDSKPAPGGAPAAPSNAPNAPDHKGVRGTITVAGALNATFEAKDDLLGDCTWVSDLKLGVIHVTLSDGKDTFMALEGVFSKERTEVSVSSAKLDRAGFKQTGGGVVITGTDAPETVTAQFDATTKAGGKTITVKGTLVARCN